MYFTMIFFLIILQTTIDKAPINGYIDAIQSHSKIKRTPPPRRRTSANFTPKQFNNVLDFPTRPSSAAAAIGGAVRRQSQSVDRNTDNKENFSFLITAPNRSSENVRNSFSHTPPNKMQSPPQSPVSRASICYSPQTQYPWTRERNLEKEIEELKEKLMDTEERFQSLKMQHDTLSESHRLLKETHTQFQDETDKLKIEVQHLSECANVLRFADLTSKKIVCLMHHFIFSFSAFLFFFSFNV